MVKPSKSANLTNKHLTRAEKQKRTETESQLKGSSDRIVPSKHLNTNQKKIFNYIVEHLKASEVLGNLDSYILDMGAIAIDRLQVIEKEINRDFALIYDKNLMASKGKYTTDFFKCCEQLCLSPSSRAKLGAINMQAETDAKDPLLKLLNGGK